MLQATLITKGAGGTAREDHQGDAFILRSYFNQVWVDLIECDLNLILESMHIAFMQREALRFEAIFDDIAELVFVHDDETSSYDESDSSSEGEYQESSYESQSMDFLLKTVLSDSDYEEKYEESFN